MSAINTGLGQAQESTSITTTTNQQSVGGAADAGGQNALSQQITLGQGASLSLEQSSPQALAALQNVAGNALMQASTQVGAISKLAETTTQQALDAAKNALMPADQRNIDLVKTVVFVLGLAAAAYFATKKG